MEHATLSRALMRRDSSANQADGSQTNRGRASLGLLPRGQVHKLISIPFEGRQRLKVQLNLKVDRVRENQIVPHS
jgi:hypothetical protein